MSGREELTSMLEVADLSVTYGVSRALLGVDLTVGDGEFVALVGANGAGKTSMLRAVSGAVPYSGRVSFGGVDLRGRRVDEVLRLGLAHVPQGRYLFPRMSVRDNLLVGGITVDAKRAQERLAELESHIDVIRDRRSQLSRTMSGGEQQVVAVARGLMSSPRMLLLDEPSLGLAPLMIEKVMNIVNEQRAEGVSVVLAEQNLAVARRYAERLVVLRQGKIVMDVRTEEADEQEIVHAVLGGETKDHRGDAPRGR